MSLGGNISHKRRWVGVVDFVAGRVFLEALGMAVKFSIYDLRFEISHKTSSSGARASARFNVAALMA